MFCPRCSSPILFVVGGRTPAYCRPCATTPAGERLSDAFERVRTGEPDVPAAGRATHGVTRLEQRRRPA